MTGRVLSRREEENLRAGLTMEGHVRQPVEVESFPEPPRGPATAPERIREGDRLLAEAFEPDGRPAAGAELRVAIAQAHYAAAGVIVSALDRYLEDMTRTSDAERRHWMLFAAQGPQHGEAQR